MQVGKLYLCYIRDRKSISCMFGEIIKIISKQNENNIIGWIKRTLLVFSLTGVKVALRNR
jgi:hypothetical protein